MGDCVIIKSAEHGVVFELQRTRRADTFHARLRGRGFDGRVEVYELGPPKQLAMFFRDLAVNWRGWRGDKQWAALEGALSLTANSDSTGHTRLNVRLWDGSVHDWRLRGSLVIEAGQLDNIAAEVEAFVGCDHAV